jgi:iron-sulfur cluster repair protein YtfE (RIC family)
MNAIKFLVKEHERVRKTFAEIEDESRRYETKKKMFDTLCQELTVHEKMEQTIWYPCFENEDELKLIVEHLLSEEKEAENTMKELDKITDQDEWEKEFLKFKNAVDHHASEEEQKLFPKVGRFLSEDELDSLGKEMIEFKQQAYDKEECSPKKRKKARKTER